MARLPGRMAPPSERNGTAALAGNPVAQFNSPYAVASKPQAAEPMTSQVRGEPEDSSAVTQAAYHPQPAPSAEAPGVDEKIATISSDGKSDGLPANADLPGSGLGHAENYDWICGQVQHSRLAGGWVLRYSSLGDDDAFGGSVVLVENGDLDHLTDGQFVVVRGHLSNPEGKNTPHAFRVDAFRVIERSE
jgi:hypothetical protein